MKEKLRQWREERNLTEPSGSIVEMIKEEIDELADAINKNDEHETVDALADIIVLAANEIGLKGYDLDLVMDETIKEISSRKQCKLQKEIWDNLGASEKWKKDPQQDPATLYKADYEKAKMK